MILDLLLTRKITIKPLTIFIGSNNSGKSYASMLIRSIVRSAETPKSGTIFPRDNYSPSLDIFRAIEKEEHEIFKKLFEKCRKNHENKIKIPKELLEKIMVTTVDYLFKNRLEKEVSYAFASPIKDLIRYNYDSFNLKINELNLKFDGKNINLSNYPKIPNLIDDLDLGGLLKFKIINDEVIVSSKLMDAILKDEDKMVSYMIIRPIIESFYRDIISSLPTPIYYLPAARSGILQSHKVLVVSMVGLIPKMGTSRMEIPQFSGVIADFITSILNLPENEHNFYKIAEDFSREIIGGDVIFEHQARDYDYLEIKYKIDDNKIPLHRSSSTVSELAPFLLYIKYVLDEGSTLIIEEPEAHLHPKNQRILAKYLVRLIRNGIKIIMTTHSDYLIDQLNNFILLENIEPKDRSEYDYCKNDFLSKTEVGAYLFSPNGSDGYKIEEMEINEDGISEESFLDVVNDLYDENDRIKRSLYNKG